MTHVIASCVRAFTLYLPHGIYIFSNLFIYPEVSPYIVNGFRLSPAIGHTKIRSTSEAVLGRPYGPSPSIQPEKLHIEGLGPYLPSFSGFISTPRIALLYFNTGGAEGLDTGNTIPYFPPGPPVFTGRDVTLVRFTKQHNLRCQ